jgi:hypothetical protein
MWFSRTSRAWRRGRRRRLSRGTCWERLARGVRDIVGPHVMQIEVGWRGGCVQCPLRRTVRQHDLDPGEWTPSCSTRCRRRGGHDTVGSHIRIAWETVARTIERASRRHELARMEFFNQNSSSLRQLDTAPG